MAADVEPFRKLLANPHVKKAFYLSGCGCLVARMGPRGKGENHKCKRHLAKAIQKLPEHSHLLARLVGKKAVPHLACVDVVCVLNVTRGSADKVELHKNCHKKVMAFLKTITEAVPMEGPASKREGLFRELRILINTTVTVQPEFLKQALRGMVPTSLPARIQELL